jgi:hypothetical protein
MYSRFRGIAAHIRTVILVVQHAYFRILPSMVEQNGTDPSPANVVLLYRAVTGALEFGVPRLKL